ncbi:hypothetical protein Dimus_031673, partial [Dionaea muscipula]
NMIALKLGVQKISEIITTQVMEQLTADLAHKFWPTTSNHFHQVNPQYNVDPEALKRLLMPPQTPSAQIYRSSRVDASSSVNTNEISNQ